MARLLPRKDESLQLRDVTIHWQLCIQRVDFSCWRHYLLIYPLKETVTRERERQDKVYWSTFNAIEHFGAQMDKDSEQKAKAALNEPRARGLSKARQDILQNYFQDLERCYRSRWTRARPVRSLRPRVADSPPVRNFSQAEPPRQREPKKT